MIINNNSDDEQRNDFFDGPDIPEDPKEKKAPELKPDDPAYWEQEESKWEHLRVRSRKKLIFGLYIGGVVVVVGLLIWLYLHFFSPYVEEATQYGYVDTIESRGTIFKTWEGVIIPYKALMDTTRLYERDFVFTAENARVAKQLKEFARNGQPVEVTYKQYHATVPWRGSAKIIVTAVDSADARKILPPEFNPMK